MGKIKHLLRNRNVILCFALLLGLLLPQAAKWTRHLTLPALALVMTLSTIGVSGTLFRSPRSLIIPAILGILMSYGVLAGSMLGMSALIIKEEEIWKGFVILAVVPPAVAVIPFTELLKGNRTYSLVGMIGAYLGALIIMPLILLKFLGSTSFYLERLSIIALVLIVAPLIISRILLWKRLDRELEPIKGVITNWCFFVVVYTIVGLNQDIFIRQPLTLAPVAAIAILSTFFLGLIIELIGRLFRIDPKITTSLVLLGTIKNYGLAGGIALALFSKHTAVPATVSTIFMFVYVIWLGIKGRSTH